MSFPRYPAYKDSGLEWLGEVPEHWVVMALKRVATIQTGLAKGKEVEPEHCVEVPFLRVANVQDGFLDLEQIHTILIPDQSLTRYLLRPGDVLMNEGGDFDKLGRGAIWNGEIEPCIHQNHVFAVRPHSVSPSWLNAYTSSEQANSYFISRSKQSTNLASISSSNLMELLVPVVPDSETTQILDFLDRETAKIDALIAEQQRLIELLQEKRQAVISHAVTKGLNPDAPMKDSGVEWLGEVPEHWAKVRLRTLFRQEKRQDQPVHQVLSVYRDFGVIPKDSRDDNFNKTPENLSLYQLVNQNDLVINKMKAWQGSLGISPFIGITSPDYIVFTSRHHEFPGYLHFLLRSSAMVSLYRSISNGIRPAQWRIEPTNFLDLPVFLPPFEEQQHIASRINNECSNLDALTSESETSIHLLQERRSALISAAVTGQIDVRGLVPEASDA
jgi:type I restriction enzyme S subunit